MPKRMMWVHCGLELGTARLSDFLDFDTRRFYHSLHPPRSPPRDDRRQLSQPIRTVSTGGTLRREFKAVLKTAQSSWHEGLTSPSPSECPAAPREAILEGSKDLPQPA